MTFNEWIEETYPNRQHDAHATFTIEDLKSAWNNGKKSTVVSDKNKKNHKIVKD